MHSEASAAIFKPMARMLAASSSVIDTLGISGSGAGSRCWFKEMALPFSVKG
jgi:hypothetical protein